MPRFLRSWSFRLTLFYAGLFTASVAVLFGVTYWSALAYAVRDETDEIDVEFRAIVDEAGADGYAELPRIIAAHLRERAGSPVAYLLEDASGQKLAGNIAPRPPREGRTTVILDTEAGRPEIHARVYRLPDGEFLLIGEGSSALNQMKSLIARAFGVGALATLALGLAGGVIVSTSVLRRVESVAVTSGAIVAGNLSQRVPLRGSDDEFDHLAASVNAMLDRIEGLMGSMRQVSNDIAHDLRTPLTRLRQRLELARRQCRSVEEMQEALEASTQHIDAILDTFGALLRIAQLEAGQGTHVHGQVELSGLLESIAGDFAPSAEDNKQCLTADIQPRLKILGDRELLTQMIVNLLENGLRHTPSGTVVTLRAEERGAALVIEVSDNGPGIPAAERENVLRPFYRLEASRTTEGSGLGFALIAAIAKRHGATVTLSDNAPGLRVTIAFLRQDQTLRVLVV